jgi:hypothetical protein
MAIIKVKGTSQPSLLRRQGPRSVEAYETKTGDTIQKRYTVWLKQPTTLDIGDTVQVEGLYSSEIDNWTNKEGEPGSPSRSASITLKWFQPSQ